MHVKKVCLVVDIREGLDMTKVVDLTAVLAAAGWKTDIVLKEYGGEAITLAAQAADKGYDLIIAYGGDGTVNQVINGVMSTGKQSTIGVIPAGTADQWAGEMGIPTDPVKAALTLVNSESCKIDLGHVRVQGLLFPDARQKDQQPTEERNKKKLSTKTRQYFSLTDGIGLDAAVIYHTSKPLKYEVGRLAFDIAALKDLPTEHPFAVEIRAMTDGGGTDILWQGEAWQVFVANTRRYSNVVDITPDSYIDDGLLNVCVFTPGNPIKTVEQIASLLFKHEPGSSTAKYFRGAHLSIRVPASVHMHLDGSTVNLKDYLTKSHHKALQQVTDHQQVVVDYRFDAAPYAIHMAIPRTYDGKLFEKPADLARIHQERHGHTAQQHVTQSEEGKQEPPEFVNAIMQGGMQVTVIGVAPNPDKQDTYIIAGTTQEVQNNDKIVPVGVRVNDDTMVIQRTGERVTSASVQELQEGTVIFVDGKKSKRGAVKAKRVVM